MKAEVIAVGSELLLGQIVDTNSAFIAKRLAENGIEMVRTQTVGDDLKRMEDTIRDSMGRSNIIITTGGIGPTEDDLTREAIANVTNCPLTFQPRLMEQIEAIIQRRGFRVSANNRKQAYIPEGAIPIENPKGTAPGFIVEGPTWVTLTIPGVPSEMEYLMEHAVVPYLRKRFHLKREVIHYKVLRACGIGESALGLQIEDLMKEGRNPSVGTLAAIGDIRIRITAKAEDSGEADQLISETEQEIRNRLDTLIYGVDQETLQGNTLRILEERGLTLSVIETFTGGVVSQKMAATGSPSFIQGMVLPAPVSQRKFFGIPEKEFDLLIQDPTKMAASLAERARKTIGTDLGLALVGRITEEQPRGEFKIDACNVLSGPTGFEQQESPLGGEPQMVRERFSILGIDFLRKFMLKASSKI
jgi:nicotinamide-nucleotide amidase